MCNKQLFIVYRKKNYFIQMINSSYFGDMKIEKKSIIVFLTMPWLLILKYAQFSTEYENHNSGNFYYLRFICARVILNAQWQ